MAEMIVHVGLLAGGLAAALLLTPLVSWAARRMRIVDRPGTRRIHTQATPRAGGFAVVASLGLVGFVTVLLSPALREAVLAPPGWVLPLLGAGALVFTVGFMDDWLGLAARTKLLAQLLAAGIACGAGVRIETLNLGIGPVELGWLSWPLTLGWIVGATNAVNLSDGLDGLAAGIAAITAVILLAFALAAGTMAGTALMFALLGSLLGFLVFNFHPARIFLGDCGSMVLGFLLAGTSVGLSGVTNSPVPLGFAALGLSLPILDTAFSIVRRLLQRRSPFSPDRAHLHHRLIDRGMDQPRAVFVMYVVTLAAVGVGLLMLLVRPSGKILVFCAALVPPLLLFRAAGAMRFHEAFTVFRRNRRHRRLARRQRKGFERVQLRLREAKGRDQWWRAVRRAARTMGFARLTVEVRLPDGSRETLVWRLPHRQRIGPRMLYATLSPSPEGEGPLRIDVDVPVRDSVESAAQGIALFGRLLDEHPEAAEPKLSVRDIGDEPEGRYVSNAGAPAESGR